MKTPRATAQGPPRQRLRICIMHVPECPLVGRLRAEVEIALERVGAMATIEEVEGPYPSPTLLIDGAELDGYPLGSDPACRIDLPAREQIISVIRDATATFTPNGRLGEGSE